MACLQTGISKEERLPRDRGRARRRFRADLRPSHRSNRPRSGV